MAGQLPLYYKNSRVIGPVSNRKRWTEYYLLVVTVFGFLMLFAGLLWFVPNVEQSDSYSKVYGTFAGTQGPGTTESVPSGINSPLSQPAAYRSNESRSLESKPVTTAPVIAKVPDSIGVNASQQVVGNGHTDVEKRNKVIEVSPGLFHVV